jgi:hypothetical protein
VVAPDIVAGGLDSLRMSVSWLPRLDVARRVLIPVQDGMTAGDVAPLLCDRIGIFVGGSTDWKLRTMLEWGDLAHHRRAYLHVGRVNTARRIHACAYAGAHSFDGSSVTRFAKTLPLLEHARRQLPLRPGSNT